MKISRSRDETLVTVSTKMPPSMVDLLDKLARRQIRNRSDLIRSYLLEAMRAQGLIDDVELSA